MSRARSIIIDGREIWFDTSLDGQPARPDQLELLMDATGVELDDLLDTDLTQGQCILAIREAIHGNVIPPEVMERKRQRRVGKPQCRMCDRKGITKHHFVPRWIMLLLGNYQTYAPRSICTIPLCVECHYSIHDRSLNLYEGKSIVEYLKPHEAEMAQQILDDLKSQHPGVYDLIAGGNAHAYEYVTISDHIAGRFIEQGREKHEDRRSGSGIGASANGSVNVS